ncbi:hypothetical protein PINS_up003680 [Pythium insidiosum]|nr:hypothetical protein PINS_up003680 [Pythium insidiosum]
MVLVLAPIAFFAALRPAAPRVVASSVSAALSNNCDVHFVVDATTPLIAQAFGPSISARCVDAVVVDEATALIAQAFGPGISSAPHELQVHSVRVAPSLITLATGPSKSSASVRLHDRPHVHATTDTCLITHDAGSSGTSAVETSDNIKVEAADASPPLDTSTLMSCSATELRLDEADQEVNKTNDENVNENNNEKVNETKDEEVNPMNHEEISETNDEDISDNRITPFVSQNDARHRRYHPLAQTIATTTAHPDGLCVCAEVPQSTTIAFQLAAQLLPDANAVEALMCRIVRTTTPKFKLSESPPQAPAPLQSSSLFAPSTLGQRQTTGETPRLITPYRIRVAGGVTGSVAARMSGRPKRNWRALFKLTHLTD